MLCHVNLLGTLNEMFNHCDSVQKVINAIVAIIRKRVSSTVILAVGDL